jgi:hypothetical protein
MWDIGIMLQGVRESKETKKNLMMFPEPTIKECIERGKLGNMVGTVDSEKDVR